MIKELKDGLKLYHGSYCQITSPDIAKCLPFKDFGKGFYLTTSKRQAEDFSRLSLRKAIDNKKVDPNQTESFVSCFIYHNHEKLKIFTHKTTDKLWLHCVIAYRNENYFENLIEKFKKYDVICGKISDDATNITIINYMSESYGKIGTKRSISECISKL